MIATAFGAWEYQLIYANVALVLFILQSISYHETNTVTVLISYYSNLHLKNP